MSYSYDANGNRLTLAVGGKTTTYGYDDANRLKTVTDWNNGITAYTYDAANRVTQIAYPNTDSASYSYDNANRVLGISDYQGGTEIALFTYTYDPNGNRATAADSSGGFTYTYDKLDRLTVVAAPSGTTSYGYDLAGNRTSVTTGAGTITCGTLTVTTCAAYNAANELTSATSSGASVSCGSKTVSTCYGYDADGNRASATTANGATGYSYDSMNYLTGTSGTQTSSYTYNGDHNRVGLTVGGIATNEALDLAASLPRVVQQTTSGTTTTYLYGQDLLAQDNGLGEQFLLADALGSIRLITGSSGAISSTMSYDAWGNQTGSGSVFGFAGQQTDAASTLLFLRARMYDPASGTFTSRDIIPFDRFDPMTVDQYTYASDTPTSLVDPAGLTSIEGSFFSGLGLGGKVSWTGSGVSLCIKAGVGYGGSFTVDPAGNLDGNISYVEAAASLDSPGGLGGTLGGRGVVHTDKRCIQVEPISEVDQGNAGYDPSNGHAVLSFGEQVEASVGACFQFSG